jgi:hypothetical protein
MKTCFFIAEILILYEFEDAISIMIYYVGDFECVGQFEIDGDFLKDFS